MNMKYPMAIFTTVICAIILFAFLPTFVMAGNDHSIRENDGAEWVRFNYSTGTTATVEYEIDGANLIIGGTAPQSGPLKDMIIWADNNLCVFIQDEIPYYTAPNSSGELSDNFTISKLNNGVRINDDGTILNFPASTWAYIPNANGTYAFFANGTSVILNDNTTVASAGMFAYVFAYNDNVSVDGLGVSMQKVQDDNELSGVYWGGTPDLAPEPDVIDIIPFDPGIINPFNPGVVTPMSVIIPDYTDGDWGYNLDGSDAIIVSYSGSAGNITIPATVGGYPVKSIGEGGNGGTVFDPDLGNSNITISSGITAINDYAFIAVTGIQSVTFPSTLTSIGRSAFSYCSNITELNLPSNLTSIGGSAFYECTGLTELNLPSNLTSIGGYAFYGCTGLEGDLIIPNSVTTVYNGAFQNCTGLTSFTLSSNMTSISSSMFRGCTGLEGDLIIPSNITEIGGYAFTGCTGYYGLIITPNVTSIGTSAFSGTNISEVLNFSDLEITTTSYGLNADAVGDDIQAVGYIVNLTYTVQIRGNGMVSALLLLLPLIFLIGLALYITYRIRDRDNFS